MTIEIVGLTAKPIEIDLQKQLKITEDIDTEVDQAAFKFGYHAVLAEKASLRYERLKFSFENWQARLETQLIKDRNEEIKKTKDVKLKPYTGDQLKALVRADSKYVRFKNTMLRFEYERNVLKVIADSFSKKKDLIQTKASNRRAEK